MDVIREESWCIGGLLAIIKKPPDFSDMYYHFMAGLPFVDGEHLV